MVQQQRTYSESQILLLNITDANRFLFSFASLGLDKIHYGGGDRDIFNLESVEE